MLTRTLEQTKGLSLEEINEVFGDIVAVRLDAATGDQSLDDKENTAHVAISDLSRGDRPDTGGEHTKKLS